MLLVEQIGDAITADRRSPYPAVIGHYACVRRRFVTSIVVLALGGIIVAVVVYFQPTTTRTVQLLPNEVRVTKCESDMGDLTGAADVVNPMHSRANLIFALQFYRKNQNVGLVQYVVPNVGPGKHTSVTDTGTPDASLVEQLMALGQVRLTCSVVKFGDGGIVPPRT